MINDYPHIGFSDRYLEEQGKGQKKAVYPSVTLALAKKKGTNAVDVARDIIKKVEDLKAHTLPDGVHLAITRNYGQTAQDKVNNLLSSLLFAVLTVVLLLAFALGWREALVVALAVPISFSLALFVNYLAGYTINRVTLFALILSLGLVVDDPITNVDNIQRHILMRRRNPFDATLAAVNDLATSQAPGSIAVHDKTKKKTVWHRDLYDPLNPAVRDGYLYVSTTDYVGQHAGIQKIVVETGETTTICREPIPKDRPWKLGPE